MIRAWAYLDALSGKFNSIRDLIMLTCSPSRILLFISFLAASANSAHAETAYFEGNYVCGKQETRSFWALNFENNEVHFGLRRLNVQSFVGNNNNSGFETGTLVRDGQNIQIKGANFSFDARGTLSADGTALDLAWFNKGQVLKRCQPFALTNTVASPVKQWDALIALLNTPAPTVVDMETMGTLVRKLPNRKFLPTLDQQNYQKKRQKSFVPFLGRYRDGIPQVLAETEVATPEDRAKLRSEMIRMSKLGYRAALTSHYAQRLYQSNQDVVPAFFGDQAGHCEQLKGKIKLSSAEDVENFVGLPRYWWTREQATDIIERAENCGANDRAIARSAKQLVTAISRQYPQFEASVSAKKILVDEANKHAALEPGIASLAQTAQYTIPANKRRQLGTSQFFYQLFYLDGIAEAKAASIKTGKEEVEKMFEGDAPIKPSSGLAKAPLRCSEVFGIRFDDIESPYAQLNDHCRETAKAIMQNRLETLSAALNSSEPAVEDLVEGGELDFNRDSLRAATQLDLQDQANAYFEDLNTKLSSKMSNHMSKQISKGIRAIILSNGEDVGAMGALCDDAEQFKEFEHMCRQIGMTPEDFRRRVEE